MTYVVLCAGGHARVLIDILTDAGTPASAVYDDDTALHGTAVCGVTVKGKVGDAANLDAKEVKLVNALGNRAMRGQSGLMNRAKLFQHFTKQGFVFPVVQSPSAHVARDADLADGVQIITEAIIHPGTSVGENVIVNTAAQVDHDCRIGAHTHIAPGAVVCGDVAIGARVHVGAGAIINQGVTIGDDAVIAAGAVVVSDVRTGATVLGSPAREAPPS